MKARYMESIRTRLLQEGMFYGVNKDSPLTRRHVIWGHYRLASYIMALYWGLIRLRLLQEGKLYGVSKASTVTRKHVKWCQ
jgi:hypothetical protein